MLEPVLGKECRCKVSVTADRSLSKLREERHEQGELEEVMLSFALSSVDIYDIAEGLEGIE
jgi:hypothetical protein